MGDETEETNDFTARRGKFSIAAAVVQDAPAIVVKVLAGVLVMDCRYDPMDQVFLYGGCHADFEALEEGSACPSYDMAYDEDTDTVSWSKAA